MMLNTRSCMLHGVEANSHSSSCDEVAKNKFCIVSCLSNPDGE